MNLRHSSERFCLLSVVKRDRILRHDGVDHSIRQAKQGLDFFPRFQIGIIFRRVIAKNISQFIFDRTEANGDAELGVRKI